MHQPMTLPQGKDITDFYLNGSDLYEWIRQMITKEDTSDGC